MPFTPIYIKPKIAGLPRLAAGKLPDAENGEQTGNSGNHPHRGIRFMEQNRGIRFMGQNLGAYDLRGKITPLTISGPNFLHAPSG